MTSIRRSIAMTSVVMAGALLATHAGAQTIIVDRLASYDPMNPEIALQEAIDTPGITKVLVRNLDDDGLPLSWVIETGIELIKKVDLELEFESGVTLEAKTGFFNTGVNDYLFRVQKSNFITLTGPGATFKMQKAEYGALGNSFRHALLMDGVYNMAVDGLTFLESGGDGLYLSVAGTRDVTIRNVISDNNRRQGMSVISVDGLLIEDSIFRNTALTNGGELPRAGIDFEPDDPTDQLKNIIVRNSSFLDNEGDGITINPRALNALSDAIDIRIENVTIDGSASSGTSGNGRGIAIRGAGVGTSIPDGTIVVEGGTIANTPRSGILFRNKLSSPTGLDVDINNVTLTNVATLSGNPIEFDSDSGLIDMGDVDFLNVTVNDDGNNRPFLLATNDALGNVEDIAGNFIVDNPTFGINFNLTGVVNANDLPNGVNISTVAALVGLSAVTAIPEPSSLVLGLAGLVFLGLRIRRSAMRVSLALGCLLFLLPTVAQASHGTIALYTFDDDLANPVPPVGFSTVIEDVSGNGRNVTYNKEVLLSGSDPFNAVGGSSAFTWAITPIAVTQGQAANATSISLAGSTPHQLTIEAWVNPTRVDVNQSVLELRDDIPNTTRIWLGLDETGVIEGRFFSQGNGGGAFMGSTSILANEWTHIALVYNLTDVNSAGDGTTRLYVNGVEDASLSTPFTLTDSLTEVILAQGGNGQFLGRMDDVRISDLALTTSELGFNYPLGGEDGDFDVDADADGSDFLRWQRGFGATHTTADLAEWEAAYGTVYPAALPLTGSLAAGVEAIPEPTSTILLLLGVAGGGMVRLRLFPFTVSTPANDWLRTSR